MSRKVAGEKGSACPPVEFRNCSSLSSCFLFLGVYYVVEGGEAPPAV